MQGSTKFFGTRNVEYVIVNIHSHPLDIPASNHRLERYQLSDFERVRLTTNASAKTMLGQLGQFGYGYVVIDKDGLLRSINGSHKHDEKLISSLLFEDEKLQDTSVETRVIDKKGGRGIFIFSHTLTKKVTAKIQVQLKIPSDWYLRAELPSGLSATTVKVNYKGKAIVGTMSYPKSEQGGIVSEHYGGITVTIPVEIPKGSQTGRYPIFGEIEFQACNSQVVSPITRLNWSALVYAL